MRIASLLALLASTALAGSAEWTRFRGPGGTGVAQPAALPVQWTDADYNWKVTLPWQGPSSPVVWGGRIFLTAGETVTQPAEKPGGPDKPEAAPAKIGRQIVACIDAANGKILWQHAEEAPAFTQHKDNSYGAVTPALDARHVYVMWMTPSQNLVLALTHDGKLAWRRTFGAFTAIHGSGASPIVFEDLLIVPNDQGRKGKSSLLALDCASGKTRWEIERAVGQAAYSTPCIHRFGDGPPELLLTSHGSGVTSLDPKTGALNWELSRPFAQRVVFSPVVAAGLVFAGCGQGGIGRDFIAVRPSSKADGTKPEIAYRLKKSIPYVPTPVAKDGLLFVCSDRGIVTCLRAATGKPVWQEQLHDNFYSSPILVGDRIYFLSKKGTAHVFRAGETFEPLGKTDLGEGTFATPAVAGGRMYVRTFTHLMSLGKGNH